MFKTVGDMQKFGKMQVEAMTESAAAVSRGFQQIAAETSAFSNRTVEDGSAAVSRLMGAKSLDGAVQVQADYAKASLDGLMSQAGKVGALLLAAGQEAAKPFEGALSPFKAG